MCGPGTRRVPDRKIQILHVWPWHPQGARQKNPDIACVALAPAGCQGHTCNIPPPPLASLEHLRYDTGVSEVSRRRRESPAWQAVMQAIIRAKKTDGSKTA